MNQKYFETYRRLGCKIAYYRKLRNYTQQELAELVGIDRTHMSSIECARTSVSLQVLFKVATVLQVPLGQFFQ